MIVLESPNIYLNGGKLCIEFDQSIHVNITMCDEQGVVLYNEVVSLDGNEVFYVPISLEEDIIYYFTITHPLHGQIIGECKL